MKDKQRRAMFAKLNSPRASPMKPYIIKGNTAVDTKTGDKYFKPEDARRPISVERKESGFVTTARPEERKKVAPYLDRAIEEQKEQRRILDPAFKSQERAEQENWDRPKTSKRQKQKRYRDPYGKFVSYRTNKYGDPVVRGRAEDA